MSQVLEKRDALLSRFTPQPRKSNCHINKQLAQKSPSPLFPLSSRSSVSSPLRFGRGFLEKQVKSFVAAEWTGSAIIAGVIRNGVRRTGRDGRHDGRGGKTEPRAEETGVNPPQRSCLRADKWREFNLIYDQRPGPSPLKAHSKHRICASFNFILLFGDFVAVTF